MWRYQFRVPDERLFSHSQAGTVVFSRFQMGPVNIQIVFKKNAGGTFVTWTGIDYGTGLKEKLGQDSQLQEFAHKVGNFGGDLRIRGIPGRFQGWVIEITGILLKNAIAEETWDTLIRISEYLLSAPTSSQVNT